MTKNLYRIKNTFAYTKLTCVAEGLRQRRMPRPLGLQSNSPREKERDLTQSYYKNHTPIEIPKSNVTPQNATKMSIIQRLRADLGRPVGVTAATPLVWLNSVFERSTSHLTATAVLLKNQKNTHLRHVLGKDLKWMEIDSLRF